jgi:hypothetical protein
MGTKTWKTHVGNVSLNLLSNQIKSFIKGCARFGKKLNEGKFGVMWISQKVYMLNDVKNFNENFK